MAETVLRITDLCLDFLRIRVFHHLNLRVEAGQVKGIMGKSGRGKTTLLRIVAGLETHYKGNVKIGFRRPAYVFQDARLLPWLTAEENIALPLFPRLGKAQALNKARRYLGLMDLEPFGPSKPSQLSGGMAQRVGIARALAYEPDMLLLDEPFSAMDSQLRKKLICVVKNHIRERNVTTLLVSHNPADMKELASEIIRI